MNFEKAFAEINQSLMGFEFPFPMGGGEKIVNKIQKEFDNPLPIDFVYYLKKIATQDDYGFLRVGNSLNLYGFSNISSLQEGYNFNPFTKEKIPEWLDNWLIIADEGSDPIIIDLLKAGKVFQSIHGEDNWNFFPIADSISQFFLCCTALHYTLSKWGQFDAINTSKGFYLKEDPASWFFPKMKIWAGKYYSQWCGIFDNANQSQ